MPNKNGVVRRVYTLKTFFCINNTKEVTMKTFNQLRENKVFDMKMGGYTVTITKNSKGFQLVIDGDRVDVFKTQKEAESTAKQVLKALGKMK